MSLIFRFEKLYEWYVDFCSKFYEYLVLFVLCSDGIEYNLFLYNNYVYTDGWYCRNGGCGRGRGGYFEYKWVTGGYVCFIFYILVYMYI